MPKYSEKAHSGKAFHPLSLLKQKASSERVAALNEHIASIYPRRGNLLPIRRWGEQSAEVSLSRTVHLIPI